MSIFAIWIDRENAKVFEFVNGTLQKKRLQAKIHNHHTHRMDHLDHMRQENTFFSQVSGHLANASQLLILGPGVAKQHFQNYLTAHNSALAKKIIGCETVDHPTDSQIAALARKFFKKDSFVELHNLNRTSRTQPPAQVRVENTNSDQNIQH